MEENISIGTLLKSTRENKNISLEEISQKTKININILKSLELSELDRLPNKTYVRGFVTNYARAVGLSVDEAKLSLEQSYNKELSESTHTADVNISPDVTQAQSPEPTQASESSNSVNSEQLDDLKDKLIALVKEVFSKKVIIGVTVIAISGVAIKAVTSFIGQLNNEQQDYVAKDAEAKKDILLKSQDANILEMEATKKLAVEISKDKTVASLEEVKPLPTIKPIVNEVKKNTNDKIDFVPKEIIVKKIIPIPKKEVEKKAVTPIAEKVKPLLEKGQFPFRRFYKPPTKMFQVQADAPENSDVSLLPANIRASSIPEKQNVYIVAHEGDTWISYKKDDLPIKKFVLKQGRRVLIKGDKVLVFLGNMNVTRIFYNNKLISAQTKTGVKSLIFPQEIASEFELPLFPSYKGIQYNAAEYKEKMAPAPIQ